MIAVQYIIENRSANLLENILLGTLCIEDIIKHERYLFLPGVFDDELALVAHSVYFVGVSSELFRVEGSEPAEDFYVAVAFFLHSALLYLLLIIII
jgi:hypothetical protein